ncbi:hypothetical protein NQ318_012658 [Aromia moschata]|uniref:MYND-type domain-containing protein n=1 Tax=Aromia moschata TaxID=1265417 RepID=A0AAV8X9A2_9CUCU|nr:hypothetical protein NQ318_012658 [Aromia moschata]
MVPCKNCASALYCSDTCRNLAFDSHHQYECNIDPSLLERDVVLRLTVLGIKEYEQNKKLGQDKFPSCGYEDIYHLKTNEDKRDDAYLFEIAVTAGATFHALKYCTKFLEETTFDENKLKEIIFRNVLIQRTNGVTVYKSDVNMKREFVGNVLYAFSKSLQSLLRLKLPGLFLRNEIYSDSC